VPLKVDQSDSATSAARLVCSARKPAIFASAKAGDTKRTSHPVEQRRGERRDDQPDLGAQRQRHEQHQVREHQQEHADREQVEVRDLEHAEIAARLGELLLGAEVVRDHRGRREAHLGEVEQGVGDPEQRHVHGVRGDDHLQEAIAAHLAGDHEAHGYPPELGWINTWYSASAVRTARVTDCDESVAPAIAWMSRFS